MQAAPDYTAPENTCQYMANLSMHPGQQEAHWVRPESGQQYGCSLLEITFPFQVSLITQKEMEMLTSAQSLWVTAPCWSHLPLAGTNFSIVGLFWVLSHYFWEWAVRCLVTVLQLSNAVFAQDRLDQEAGNLLFSDFGFSAECK